MKTNYKSIVFFELSLGVPQKSIVAPVPSSKIDFSDKADVENRIDRNANRYF